MISASLTAFTACRTNILVDGVPDVRVVILFFES